MTNKEINICAVSRFFEAVARLKADGVLRGLQTFTTRYGYDRRNMVLQRRDPERGQLRPSWLYHLAEDYKVSAEWLILGTGDFYKAGFTPEIVKKLQETCNE